MKFFCFCLNLCLAMFLIHRDASAASQNSKFKVYIVHGYAATADDHWFPWLKRTLAERGVQTEILQLPDSHQPRWQQWQQALQQQLAETDQRTIIVSHSLGSITTLAYLANVQPAKPLHGLIIVSGFNHELPGLPQLNSFYRPELNYAQVRLLAKHRIVLASENDSIVAPAYSQALSKDLAAEYFSLTYGGHFLASDGFKSFPLLLQHIDKMMALATD